MNILEFLNMQRQLQINMKVANPTQGGDPYEMNSEQLAWFMTWNFKALVKELSEATDECGWKPWASSRHIDGTAFLSEMVDAWHFFLNMMLAAGAWMGDEPADIAEFFENYYQEKNAKNLQRQVEGYDGVSTKCPICKRELSESECTPNYCNNRKVEIMPTPGADEAGIARQRQQIEEASAKQPGSGTAEELAAAAEERHTVLQQERGFSEAENALQGLPTRQHADPADLFPQQVLIGGAELSIGGKAAKIIAEVSQTGEPIFIFRAKDIFSVQVVADYITLLEKYGPESHDMVMGATEQLAVMKQWQRDNIHQVRYPD